MAKDFNADLVKAADQRAMEAALMYQLAGVKPKNMSVRLDNFLRGKKSSNGNGHTKPIEAKRRKSSAKVKSARVLHGQLMGLSRGLNDTQKAHVKSVRAQKGVRQAIRVAKNIRKQFVAEA